MLTRSLVAMLLLFVSAVSQADLTCLPQDARTVQATGSEASTVVSALQTLLGSSSETQLVVNNVDCEKGIDIDSGQINCGATMTDKPGFLHLGGSQARALYEVVQAAKKQVYANPAARLDPRYDYISVQSAACSAGTCQITFGSGGGAI